MRFTNSLTKDHDLEYLKDRNFKTKSGVFVKKLYLLLCFCVLILTAVVYIAFSLRDLENNIKTTSETTAELDAIVSKIETLVVDTTISETKTVGDTTVSETETNFDFIIGEELKEGRVVAFMNSLKMASGIYTRILVYSCWSHSVSPNAGIIEYAADSVVMCVDERILKDFSDDALEGLVAHELGHFYYGHTRGSQLALWEKDNRGFKKMAQAEADAFAIRFIGRKKVTLYIKSLNLGKQGELLRMNRADEMFKKKF